LGQWFLHGAHSYVRLEPAINFRTGGVASEIAPDEAEAEGFGVSKVEADNKV
jgi:hypothetical protein